MTKILMGLGATIPLEGYASARVYYEQEAVVNEGDDINRVRAKLYKEVDGVVENMIRKATNGN